MSMTWMLRPHAELTTVELYAILRLRTDVFIVEQNCPFGDADGLDLTGKTHHLMGMTPDGELGAYARLMDPEHNDGESVIGRVVTASAVRGTGAGHTLMSRAVGHVDELWPGTTTYLSAQAHLVGYYGRYGFTPVTEIYLEDGIPHVGMRRTPV